MNPAIALTKQEADHAIQHSRHCHCATCLGVKLAFALSEDTTLRIEVRDSRVPGAHVSVDSGAVERAVRRA